MAGRRAPSRQPAVFAQTPKVTDPPTQRALDVIQQAILDLQARRHLEQFTATEPGYVPLSGTDETAVLHADGVWRAVGGSGSSGVSSVTAGSSMVTASPTTGDVIVDVVPANFTGIPESGVTNLVADLAARPTGTGTANRVVKWTGASTQGDSRILDDGADLQFISDRMYLDRNSGDGRLRFASVGNANYIQSGLNGTSGSAAPLVFTTMNAAGEWARFDTGGKFGIGASVPSEQLHVLKTTAGAVGALVQKTTTTGAAFFEANDSSGIRARLQCNVASSNPFVGTITSHPFDVVTGNSVRATFDTSGRMGVNCTPGFRLQVREGTPGGTVQPAPSGTILLLESADGAINYLTFRGTGQKGFRFANASGSNDGGVFYDASVLPRGFGYVTAGVVRSMLDSNGTLFLGDKSDGNTAIAANVDVLNLRLAKTGQTADTKALVNASNVGSYNTTSAGLTAYGLRSVMSATRSAGANTFDQRGIESRLTNGQASNYGFFSDVQGAATNIAYYANATTGSAYSFYGNAGQLWNQGNATLYDAPAAGLNLSLRSDLGKAATFYDLSGLDPEAQIAVDPATPTLTISVGSAGLPLVPVPRVTIDGVTGKLTALYNTQLGNSDTHRAVARGELQIQATGADSAPVLYLTNDAKTWYMAVEGAASDRFSLTESGASTWTKWSAGGELQHDGVLRIHNALAKFGVNNGDTYIAGAAVNGGYSQNAAADLYLNYAGYLAGFTQFRNLIVANGKSAPIATFEGATKSTALEGVLVVKENVTIGPTTGDASLAIYNNAGTGYENAVRAMTFGASDVGLAFQTGNSAVSGVGTRLRIHETGAIEAGDAAGAVASNVDVLTVTNTGTGQTTTDKALLRLTHSGSFDTSGGAKETWGIYSAVTATRSAGASNLTNRAALFTASGAQVNEALRTEQGNVVLGGATTIDNTLSVTGNASFDGNATLGNGSGDTHTLNGNLTLSNPPTAGSLKYGSLQARLFIKRQVFTSGGTYTPSTDCKAVLVRMVGGGGGGGGAGGGAGARTAGGGGASGVYWEKWIEPGANITGGTVTIGAAGSAGTSGGGNGGAGGDTSVVVQAVTYTAKGGAGGTGLAVDGYTQSASPQTGSSAGDFVAGGAGGAGLCHNAGTIVISGFGGSNPIGLGSGTPLDSAGTAGAGFGAGGSGGNHTGTTDRAGGSGSAGVVIIEEYA